MPQAIDKLEAGIAAVVHPSVPVGMWADLMKQDLIDAEIGKTGRRIAAFIGQISVESAGFTAIEENLNYSAERLCAVWPSRFPTSDAAGMCAYRPVALANTVYADRMGNGDAYSGDGWRYRGAGLIQLTGKTNQLACAAALKVDPAQIGDYLRTPSGALASAVWFWNAHDLNSYADRWLLTAMSKLINGGPEGLQQRINACNAVLAVVGQ